MMRMYCGLAGEKDTKRKNVDRRVLKCRPTLASWQRQDYAREMALPDCILHTGNIVRKRAAHRQRGWADS